MNLPSNLKSKVASILVFGDPALKLGGSNAWPINSPSVDRSPRLGSSSSQNIASFCNLSDIFCDPLGANLAAHLAYPLDGRCVGLTYLRLYMRLTVLFSVQVAAAFVKARN